MLELIQEIGAYEIYWEMEYLFCRGKQKMASIC